MTNTHVQTDRFRHARQAMWFLQSYVLYSKPMYKPACQTCTSCVRTCFAQTSKSRRNWMFKCVHLIATWLRVWRSHHQLGVVSCDLCLLINISLFLHLISLIGVELASYSCWISVETVSDQRRFGPMTSDRQSAVQSYRHARQVLSWPQKNVFYSKPRRRKPQKTWRGRWPRHRFRRGG